MWTVFKTDLEHKVSQYDPMVKSLHHEEKIPLDLQLR